MKLAAAAAEIHDQLRRDAPCDVGAEILLDQRQRQVEPGGHAGGGADLAVADMDGVDFEHHLGKAFGELVGHRPMRGGAPAGEQAASASRKAPVHTDP